MADELRMRASLVDNASPQLQNIATNMRRVGGVNLAGVRREVSALGTTFSNVGAGIKGVILPAFAAFGLSTAGLALGLAATGRSMKDFSDKTRELQIASRQFGITANQIRAFQRAASEFRIAPDEALQGLATFFRNAEDFKMKIGSLREELFRLGAGDIVTAIARAKTSTDALRIAFERMQYLQKTNPAVARRFAESVFGSAKFAEMGWNDLLKAMEKMDAPTKKMDANVESLFKSLNDMRNMFDETGNKMLGSLAPGLDHIVNLITKIGQDKNIMGPISEAITGLSDALLKIKKEDLEAIADAIGSFIKTIAGAVSQDIKDIVKFIELMRELKGWMDSFFSSNRAVGDQKQRLGMLEAQRDTLNKKIDDLPVGDPMRKRLEERRDQTVKQIDDLKQSLKDLEKEIEKSTDLMKKSNLMMEFGGSGAGGNGIMNAAYHPGGGMGRPRFSPRSLGSSEFPLVDGDGIERGTRAARKSAKSVFETGTSDWQNQPKGSQRYPGGKFRGTGDNTLDAIIAAEGTAKRGDPFNETLGYGKYAKPDKPLTEMTLREAYLFGRKIRARHGSSSAIGAFQIVGQTMKDVGMPGAGLNWDDKFSPENQMKMARAIRARQGLGAWEGFKHHPDQLAKAQRGGRYSLDNPAFTRGTRGIEGLDAMNSNMPGMTATGTVNVNVNAPSGTKVSADSDGLFQSTKINRATQMPSLPSWAEQ